MKKWWPTLSEKTQLSLFGEKQRIHQKLLFYQKILLNYDYDKFFNQGCGTTWIFHDHHLPNFVEEGMLQAVLLFIKKNYFSNQYHIKTNFVFHFNWVTLLAQSNNFRGYTQDFIYSFESTRMMNTLKIKNNDWSCPIVDYSDMFKLQDWEANLPCGKKNLIFL